MPVPAGQISRIDAGSYVNATPNQEQLICDSLGLLSQSFNILGAPTSTAITSQTIHTNGVWLFSGQTVSNIVVGVETAASGTDLSASHAILGLANKNGKVLAVSGVASPILAASYPVGFVSFALATPFSVVDSGLYRPFLWMNGTFGTTQPKFYNGPASAKLTNQTVFGNLGTSITTLPAVGDADTFSAAAGLAIWFGVS